MLLRSSWRNFWVTWSQNIDILTGDELSPTLSLSKAEYYLLM